MQTFISCDWGTSNFRIRLVDAATQTILGEVKSHQGIADTHELWKQLQQDEEKRFSFYQTFIQHQLERLQEQVTVSLLDLPLIISGMASSSIGMVKLPYKELPFATHGRDLEFAKINSTGNFRHDVVIISGAKTVNDVMRGEEAQLIGCDFNSDEEHIYIFPGTHSKHVTVKNQKVIDFKTFMTGEFFHLLSNDSILSTSVQDNKLSLTGSMLKSFEDGVGQSSHDNLLHNAFLVRTNQLFDHYSKEENYFYLSGVLIGTELRELVHSSIPLTVVGNEAMRQYYASALSKLGSHEMSAIDADEALVKGHSKVYHVFQKNR